MSVLSPGVPRVFLHAVDPASLGMPWDDPGLIGIEHRALVLALPGDLVILGSAPDPGFLGALRSIGSGPDDEGVIVVDNWDPPYPNTSDIDGAPCRDDPYTLTVALTADRNALDRLRDALRGREQPAEMAVYMGGADDWIHEKLARDPVPNGPAIAYMAGDAPGTEWFNAKSSLTDIRSLAGVPQIPGRVAERRGVLGAMRGVHGDHPGHGLIVRAESSVAGLGVWTVSRSDARDGRFGAVTPDTGHLWDDEPILVEPLLSVRTSPNVQFDLRPDGVDLIGATDQIMHGGADDDHAETPGVGHRGNRSPMTAANPDEVLRQARAIAELMHRSAMRGVIGIDLIECRPGEALAGEAGVFVVEVNARVNTSTFGLVALNRLLGEGWPQRYSAAIVPGVGAPGCGSFADLAARLNEAGERGSEVGAPSDPDPSPLPELMPGLPRGVFVTRPPTPLRQAADLVVLGPSSGAALDRPNAAETRLATIERRLRGAG